MLIKIKIYNWLMFKKKKREYKIFSLYIIIYILKDYEVWWKKNSMWIRDDGWV